MSFKNLLLVAIFITLRGYVCETIIEHENELPFGKFHFWDMCPPGTTANGFEVKAGEEEKNFSDDEGMTGIRLTCSDRNGLEKQIINSYSLNRGNWKGKQMCPEKEWLTGLRIQIQSYSGWVRDDTAANNIEMNCNFTSIYNGKGTNRGKWTNWATCPTGEFICGLSTKVEDKIITDRVGLVAVHMQCCNLFGNNTSIYSTNSTVNDESDDGEEDDDISDERSNTTSSNHNTTNVGNSASNENSSNSFNATAKRAEGNATNEGNNRNRSSTTATPLFNSTLTENEKQNGENDDSEFEKTTAKNVAAKATSVNSTPSKNTSEKNENPSTIDPSQTESDDMNNIIFPKN